MQPAGIGELAFTGRQADLAADLDAAHEILFFGANYQDDAVGLRLGGHFEIIITTGRVQPLNGVAHLSEAQGSALPERN